MSPGVLGWYEVPGTNDEGPGAVAASLNRGVAGDSELKAGVCRRGHLGRILWTISAAVTRPEGRSTAGGCDVSDAAVRITVNPMPTSVSANLRRLGKSQADITGCCRTISRLKPPRKSRMPSST